MKGMKGETVLEYAPVPRVRGIVMTREFREKHRFLVFRAGQNPIVDEEGDIPVPLGLFASAYCAAQTALHECLKEAKYVYDELTGLRYAGEDLRRISMQFEPRQVDMRE